MTHDEEALQSGRDTPKISLRLPPGLRADIKKASQANKRPVNAEIMLRLAQSVSDETNTVYGVLKTQLGLVQFLADCVEQLTELLTEEQRADTRVALMLELSKSVRISDSK